MSAKPRLLVPDTNVIIEAMRRGRWVQICVAYEVVVPSIIAKEMDFFPDLTTPGKRHHVTLTPLVHGKHNFVLNQPVSGAGAIGGADPAPDPAGGEFLVWGAPVAEFNDTKLLLHPDLRERLDEGEQEAVTYLRLLDDEASAGVAFATADVGGILATVAFDRTHCAVSLESILRKCGYSAALANEFRESHVQACVRDGQIRVAQGRALAHTTAPASSPARVPRRR